MSAAKIFDSLSNLSQEDQLVLSQFGQGPPRSVPFTTVHEAFEHAASVSPDSIAAVFEQTNITYRQLDVRANQLANQLLTSGLKPGERVCLVVSRSIEMLVGIFAILKSGCQYVPIDGGVASDRQLSHIFTDTAAPYILCLPKFQTRVAQFAGKETHITPLTLAGVPNISSDKPSVRYSSNDGCYAIYTSGECDCLC